MRKSALILTILTFVLIGCKSGEKHEVGFDEPNKTVNSKPDGHTSKESLDWAGVYEGTTPCADCDGIKTVVELKTDKTYLMSQTYLGKPGGENNLMRAGALLGVKMGQVLP